MDPIIPNSKLDSMVDKLYDIAPSIAALFEKFLCYDRVMKWHQYKHIQKFYRQMTLFQKTLRGAGVTLPTARRRLMPQNR